MSPKKLNRNAPFLRGEMTLYAEKVIRHEKDNQLKVYLERDDKSPFFEIIRLDVGAIVYFSETKQFSISSFDILSNPVSIPSRGFYVAYADSWKIKINQ